MNDGISLAKIGRNLTGSGAINLHRGGAQRTAAAACWLMLALFGAGCSQHTQARAYGSPDAAVDSFVAALRANDTAALTESLGSGADDLMNSGDPVADSQ